MSKEKTPQQKKASSLKHDRRNTYGENSKSSRKNVAKGKQTSHQRERHAVAQDLISISGASPHEESMIAAEGAVKSTERLLKTKRFKKVADEPLGQVLEGRRRLRKPDGTRLIDDLGRPISEPTPPRSPQLRSRIMYIESKAQGLTGPARIGRVFFSKRGGTIYYQGRSFQSLKGGGFKANYYDTETLDHYWISGPRKDGKDRLYVGGPPVQIDADVRDEYWSKIRGTAPSKKRR